MVMVTIEQLVRGICTCCRSGVGQFKVRPYFWSDRKREPVRVVPNIDEYVPYYEE